MDLTITVDHTVAVQVARDAARLFLRAMDTGESSHRLAFARQAMIAAMFFGADCMRTAGADWRELKTLVHALNGAHNFGRNSATIEVAERILSGTNARGELI